MNFLADKTELEKQEKKLKNRIIDSVRKTNIQTIVKIARFLNIPIQIDLVKHHNIEEEK